MSILDVICYELRQVPQIQEITVEYVAMLPGSLGSPEQMVIDQLYWVDWSEQLGALISPDGLKANVYLTENARDLDPGELTLGFTSTLTGICLNLQGQVAIHANAVAINGQALAFVGYSGAGKSTLSAFCTSRGAVFVTDDVLVVNEQGDVLPGNPRIKLYPETGELLGLEASEETDYKVFYHPETHLGGIFSQEPVPLSEIYLLVESEQEEIYIESVPPAQSVFDLLTHAYDVSKFIDRNPRLLDAYIELIDKFPVKKLVYPHDFNRLPEVYDLLLTELSQK
jgi:hypothetical protein